ncbi:response regulator [Phenylobacterium sp.]|jgi:two-component system response regulator FixJ|uniref:response regulator transcription factor n=1 Tax=Phenylobacterium sp. TaxID=1871053 RepID=UPI000C8ACBDC|nr:response regulator [Phenylobacterium sp.]MAK80918.1 DNA-binding response regulator [Phenylobacterium sp.]|tara:strand:+ start:14201 stop:14839 length:639 start_codon:yes stop_codon:yes gene_type:complete
MTNPEGRRQVYIVDDDALMRDAIAAHFPPTEFSVESFGAARELLARLPADAVGCVVTDVRMSPMDGVALTEALRAQAPKITVVVVTAHADVALAVSAMKAGARDFFEKTDDLARLVEAVRALDQTPPEDLAAAAERDGVRQRLQTLTARELEILVEIGQGRTGRQISDGLGISVRTVEAHRRALMLKMGAARLGHLVRMATLSGLDSRPSDA